MTRNDLIEAGVKSLRMFGYPNCNSENILTDAVYKRFFKADLLDVKDIKPSLEDVANALIKEIEEGPQEK